MVIGIILSVIVFALLIWSILRDRHRIHTYLIEFKEVGWTIVDKVEEVKAENVWEAFKALGISPNSCFSRFDAKWVVYDEENNFIGFFR